jgi:hypothetical protein
MITLALVEERKFNEKNIKNEREGKFEQQQQTTIGVKNSSDHRRK